MQPRQRAFDDAPHIGGVDPRQVVEVGNELGMHPQRPAVGGFSARVELAVECLDAGIDIGAVDRVEPGIDEGADLGDGAFAVDRTMVPGELPAAADDARDGVAGGELRRLDCGHIDKVSIRCRGARA